VIDGEPDAKPVKKTFRADGGLEIVGEVRGRGDTALVFLHGWCGDRFDGWLSGLEAMRRKRSPPIGNNPMKP
jgi:hypothetical protein